jgi:hypothetical protein
MALNVAAAPARVSSARRAGRIGLVVWLVAVAVALVWGWLAVRTADVSLDAAPFTGRWEWHGGWRLLPAAGVGLAVVTWGPRVGAWLAWRWVPVAAGAAATSWTVALAAGDGWSRLTAPLTTRHEYEPFAAQIDGLGGFVSTYVDRLGDYPIHVQGHPPGPVVLAWALDRIGLSGPGWLAALAMVAWGVAVGSALVAARLVAGEAAARRAAPALAVLPAAIWAGTSLDAFFAALIAIGITLAITAAAGPTAVRSAVTAVVAGFVLGAALLCTYGAVPLVLVGAGLIVALAGWRALRLLVLVGGGALATLLLAARAGFWWPAGLEATRSAYWSGIGGQRPGWYLTLVGNPGVLALAAGPAVAVGLATVTRVSGGVGFGAAARPATRAVARVARAKGEVRSAPCSGGAVPGVSSPEPREWLLPVAVLVAVGLADLSQLTRGEVERIWLPFVPWLALAAPGDRRGWLGVQVGVALVLQSVLVSPW